MNHGSQAVFLLLINVFILGIFLTHVRTESQVGPGHPTAAISYSTGFLQWCGILGNAAEQQRMQ